MDNITREVKLMLNGYSIHLPAGRCPCARFGVKDGRMCPGKIISIPVVHPMREMYFCPANITGNAFAQEGHIADASGVRERKGPGLVGMAGNMTMGDPCSGIYIGRGAGHVPPVTHVPWNARSI
jgi:hypothetical protein